MTGTLTRRIQATCGEELFRLRRQMYSLVWQEIREGGVEGAATAMAGKPSCVNHGLSVDVVCFAQIVVPVEAAKRSGLHRLI